MIYLALLGAALLALGLWKNQNGGQNTDIPLTIRLMAEAIQTFEGWFPGSKSYRNNNPGNLRYTAWTQGQGATGQDSTGFSVFPTYEIGYAALTSLLMLRVRQHPDWTILDLFNSYAPPSDNNPTQTYAATVAKNAGVTVDTKLGELA
jgi:hypothetical protein